MTELWRPSAARIADANLTRFMKCLNARRGMHLADYDALYAWSLAEPEQFWTELARFADVRGDFTAGPVLEHPQQMPGARFFPNARLNFAENLLKFDDEEPALVFRNERGARRVLSYRELRTEVARVADGLRAAGVGPGDRVAGFMPNLPETTIAMLATASLGAIWTSCSPDFGVHGVLDRFGQIEPKVLFTADGYFYAGKKLDSLEPVAQVIGKIGDAVEQVGPVVEDARRLIGSANQVVTEARPRISEFSDELAGAARSAREQVERIGDLLHDAGDRARARLEQELGIGMPQFRAR